MSTVNYRNRDYLLTIFVTSLLNMCIRLLTMLIYSGNYINILKSVDDSVHKTGQA